MGPFSWRQLFYIYCIDPWICLIKGHAYEFEPMEGDEPPFEFSNCSRCGHPNPNPEAQ